MKKFVLAALTAAVAGMTHADPVITFEGLASGKAVPAGYGGLNWSNVKVLDGADAPPSGYKAGVVSGQNVAFDPNSKPAVISSVDTGGFTLVDGYFTAAWSNGLKITATALFEDASSAVKTFTLNTANPIDEFFGWTDLTSVTFASSGGISNLALAGVGRQFVFDDLTAFATPVPEPSPTSALLTGLAWLAWSLRAAARRRGGVFATSDRSPDPRRRV